MANIILTSRCNLSCEYCFAHELTESDTRDIKMDDFLEILDFAGADGEIGLIGGEPLLHKQINDFISILNGIQFRIRLPYNFQPVPYSLYSFPQTYLRS